MIETRVSSRSINTPESRAQLANHACRLTDCPLLGRGRSNAELVQGVTPACVYNISKDGLAGLWRRAARP
jgi:hypothetical protein